jgi:K+/H+ antiporter YhaU regulatory subunit KhtT
MITELKEVIAKVEQLNNEEQKRIAKMLEEEIKWEDTLHNSKKQLTKLAEEALNEHQSGLTQKNDW